MIFSCQSFGRGRTFAMSTDSTWAWGTEFERSWGEGDNRYFRKFWRNVVYWLTENRGGSNRRLQVETDKVFYRPGQPIEVTARAFDPKLSETDVYRVLARLRSPSESESQPFDDAATALVPQLGDRIYRGKLTTPPLDMIMDNPGTTVHELLLDVAALDGEAVEARVERRRSDHRRSGRVPRSASRLGPARRAGPFDERPRDPQFAGTRRCARRRWRTRRDRGRQSFAALGPARALADLAGRSLGRMGSPAVQGAGLTNGSIVTMRYGSRELREQEIGPMRTCALAMHLSIATICLSSVPVVLCQEPAKAVPRTTSSINPEDREEATIAATRALAEQLRLHPAEPSRAADRVGGLYLIVIATGEVTLVADGPDAGTTFCGSAAWSSDGRRIYFDAMRTDQVAKAHLKVIELDDGALSVKDLGVGNCPTSSPDGGEVAFLLNGGGVPGVQGGVWLMRSDGSQRRRVGGFGRPKWSPDGRQFLLTDFAIPAHARLLDVSTRNIATVQLKELEFWSAPNWVSPDLVVAVVGRGWGYTIALIDVTDPAHSKVKEVLWEMNFKGQGIDVNPHGVVYASSARRCVFIGGAREGMAVYSFVRGQPGPPGRLEPSGFDSLLQDVALSPDGRYALFTSNRSGVRQRGSGPKAQ